MQDYFLSEYPPRLTFLGDRVRPDFIVLFRVLLAVGLAIFVRREVDFSGTLLNHRVAKVLLHRHSVFQRSKPREQVERVRSARAARHLSVCNKEKTSNKTPAVYYSECYKIRVYVCAWWEVFNVLRSSPACPPPLLLLLRIVPVHACPATGPFYGWEPQLYKATNRVSTKLTIPNGLRCCTFVWRSCALTRRMTATRAYLIYYLS